MLVLPHRHVFRVRPLFRREHLRLVIDAVIAGNSPARVWVDDPVTPRTALVWDGAHCLYLAGADGDARACRELFEREIAPAGRGMFKLHCSQRAAGAVVRGQRLRRLERVLYRGDRLALSRGPHRVPEGFKVSAIGDHLPELARLGNYPDVAAEIGSCWTSMAAFLRAGFGFCAHDAEAIVCWCTAEYVSDGRCGIGIETAAACRRRGFATLTASAFAGHCAERGITPHWDAWSDNLPSVAVAERLGFRKVETYAVHVGSFGEAGPSTAVLTSRTRLRPMP